MKVSDVIIYIMKIMWKDLKKIRSSRFGNKKKKQRWKSKLIVLSIFLKTAFSQISIHSQLLMKIL